MNALDVHHHANVVAFSHAMLKVALHFGLMLNLLRLPRESLNMSNLILHAFESICKYLTIVCNEAGCGKTSLMTYSPNTIEVQFQASNLYARVNKEVIVRFMNNALRNAEKGEI